MKQFRLYSRFIAVTIRNQNNTTLLFTFRRRLLFNLLNAAVVPHKPAYTTDRPLGLCICRDNFLPVNLRHCNYS